MYFSQLCYCCFTLAGFINVGLQLMIILLTSQLVNVYFYEMLQK